MHMIRMKRMPSGMGVSRLRLLVDLCQDLLVLEQVILLRSALAAILTAPASLLRYDIPPLLA